MVRMYSVSSKPGLGLIVSSQGNTRDFQDSEKKDVLRRKRDKAKAKAEKVKKNGK